MANFKHHHITDGTKVIGDDGIKGVVFVLPDYAFQIKWEDGFVSQYQMKDCPLLTVHPVEEKSNV